MDKILIKKITRVLTGTSLFFVLNSCAFKTVTRSKYITYLAADSANNRVAQTLNVFSPHKKTALHDVLIFIHGGSWNSGKKSLYNFLGNRMARKSVVTVIIDYPKSPQANYDEMASDAARAVKWVKENIERYGGNPGRIFISGHSAGGHLAALISVRDDYFSKLGIADPVKGIILIDAAGLDMYGYLQEENFPEGNTYLQTFTNDPANWKAASPLYHLHKGLPPMLIYQGGKTYPSIAASNEKMVAALKGLGYHPGYHILKGKKHVPMITQFLNSGNRRYKEIIEFMHTEQ
jgi:acetyl esterase/lipase